MAALVVAAGLAGDGAIVPLVERFSERRLSVLHARRISADSGFDENCYAMEECVFIHTLKRQGRFVITAETVIMSGRKPRAHSFLSYAMLG